MTKLEWIEQAKLSRDALRDFVADYHPASVRYPSILDVRMPITAPSAEAACRTVREKIKSEYTDAAPAVLFGRALDDQDFHTLYRLLNSAWFGVPESTSCWQVPGFNQAVALLEDPPDDIEAFTEDEESPT